VLTEKIKEKVIEIIRKHLKNQHYKVFFFGSRVVGKGSDRSDIDIGIEAAEKIPGNIMVKIKFDLDDLAILQKIDLVDFKSVSDDFKRVAEQNIEVIYER